MKLRKQLKHVAIMPPKPRSLVDLFNATNRPASTPNTFRASASDLVDLAVTKTRFNRNRWLIDPSTFHVLSEYFQVKQYKTFAVAKPPFAPMRASEAANNARRVSVEAFINQAMEATELVPFRNALMSGVAQPTSPLVGGNVYEEAHKDEGKASIRVLNSLPTNASGPVVVHAASAFRYANNDHAYYHYEVLVAGHITATQLKKRGLAAAGAWDEIQSDYKVDALRFHNGGEESSHVQLGHLTAEGKAASETADDDKEASYLTNMEGVVKSSVKNTGVFSGATGNAMPARNRPGSESTGGSTSRSENDETEWGRALMPTAEEESSTSPSSSASQQEYAKPLLQKNGIRFFNLAPLFLPRQRSYQTPSIEQMNCKKVQVPVFKPSRGSPAVEELSVPFAVDGPAAEVAIQTHGFYGMHPVTLLRVSLFNPSTSVAPSIESFVHNVTGSFVLGDPIAMSADGCSKAFGDNPYLRRLRGDKDFPRVFVHLRKVGFAVFERDWKARKGDSPWMGHPKWIEFACNNTFEPLLSDTQMHPKKGKLSLTDGLWNPGL